MCVRIVNKAKERIVLIFKGSVGKSAAFQCERSTGSKSAQSQKKKKKKKKIIMLLLTGYACCALGQDTLLSFVSFT